MPVDDEAELRSLVRALLRDLVPASGGSTEPVMVRVESDADLQDLVRQVIRGLDDPVQGPRLRAGDTVFGLESARVSVAPSVSSPPEAPPAPQPVLEIEKGAVTERVVDRVIVEGARLVLGPRAVITPLAREHIRRAGIEVERKSC